MTTLLLINFAAIAIRISNGERLTVKHLAVEYQVKAVDLKKALVNHFGSRISFQRGRTGGIRIAA